MAVIAALAFAFSFGNVWALALRLGVPHHVAPLIAPMVDLSVIGLMVALHHLIAGGTNPDQLRPAIRLMHLCGLLTLALNTAEPVLAGHYGRAALDTVAPALLLGWGAVGPTLLHCLHTPPTTAPGPTSAEPEAAEPQAPGSGPKDPSTPGHIESAKPLAPTRVSAPAAVTAANPPQKRTGRKPAASMDQLAAIARPAVEEHGPTHAVVKKALREAGVPISNERLGELVQGFKDERATQQTEVEVHPSAA